MTIWKWTIIFAVCLLTWGIYWLVIPAFKILILFEKRKPDSEVPPHIVTITKKRFPMRYKGVPSKHWAYITYDIWEELLRSGDNE